ncbi:MAG: hypothetical protein AB7E34_01745 [Acidaminococcaceae bacterium]
MRKLFLLLSFLLLTIALTGCAKGEVVMELSRFGSADIECKIVAMPLVASQLTSVKEDFSSDGFQVENINEDKMQGFIAKKHFKSLDELNRAKIVRGFQLNKNKNNNQTDTEKNAGSKVKNTAVVYKQGLLFDTVAVNTHLDLRANKKDEHKESQWLVKNLLQQVNLRFVLKLPTASDSSNATTSPDGGKTLVWDLVLGEDNELSAQVTYLNPYKASGLFIAALGAGIIFWRKKRRKRTNDQTA